MENGTLYIVATPIGNLGDITLRAIEVLQSVTAIACEDTRKTGILLKHIASIRTPLKPERPALISYHEHNEFSRIPQIMNLLINGSSVALVSDAGMPLVSDPGYRVVTTCVENNIPIQIVPGASSVLSALAISGLPTDKFCFLGYLPHKLGHRTTLLQNIQKSSKLISQTYMLFEAPHKIIKTLQEMQEILGDIPIVLCRELTKIHQEVRRETISASLKHFEKSLPRGEFVLLFHLD